MFKDKILFFSKRCDHNNNKILTSKDLSFLSTTLFIIITRSFKLIVKNDSNKNNFDKIIRKPSQIEKNQQIKKD